MRRHLFWSLALLCLSSFVHAASTFDGVYDGWMELNDGTGNRKVALSISLTPTGQVVSIKDEGGLFEEQQVIDGSFAIDHEGGPYGFSKVSYNLERNEIDLRYNRSTIQYTPATPSAFRLIGSVELDGSLKGKVISGYKGPIGTFLLQPSKAANLEVKQKYFGTWVGKMKRTDGATQNMVVTVEEASGAQVTNPNHMELDYTQGRLAHVRVSSAPIEFSSVVIDYLRQKMYLVSLDGAGRPLMTLQTTLNESTMELEGFSNGLYTGRNGTFRLKYVK